MRLQRFLPKEGKGEDLMRELRQEGQLLQELVTLKLLAEQVVQAGVTVAEAVAEAAETVETAEQVKQEMAVRQADRQEQEPLAVRVVVREDLIRLMELLELPLAVEAVAEGRMQRPIPQVTEQTV